MADTSLPPPFEADTGPLPYAFVSYAHRDAGGVFPEIARLHAQGYRIWYDEGIDPGNEWPEEIARALAGCSFFIVFVSPDAVRSQNVRNEINFALNKGKPFLAIHIAETALPSGLELRMGDIQAVMKYRMSEDSCCRKLEKVLPASLISADVSVTKEAADQLRAQIASALHRIIEEDAAWMFGVVHMWLTQDTRLLIARCHADWSFVPPVRRVEFEKAAWPNPERPHLGEGVESEEGIQTLARRIYEANRVLEPDKPISRVLLKSCPKPDFEPPWHVHQHMGMGDVDFTCKQCGYDGFNLCHYTSNREVPPECPRCALGRRMPKDTRRY